MHPTNADRVAPGPEHRPPVLDPAALERHFIERAAEYIGRYMRPERRGRGTRQSARRKDLQRGRPYAASNVLALLAESTCDRRIPTDGICLFLDELKLDVRAARGELPEGVDFDEAMQRETTTQGRTDWKQYLAARNRSVGTLDALVAAFGEEIVAKELARDVVKRERERLASS